MRMTRRAFFKPSLVALSLLLLFARGFTGQERSPSAPSTRVLFIGNSYTYFNNLPEILTKLAEAGHQGKVEARMVAPGGYRLQDHWEKGEALKTLHEGKWDYVVLQEQSTLGVNYLLEGRTRIAGDEIFRPYARKWAAQVRKAGATPVFYLTWARKATPEDQGALNSIYMNAARKNRARVAPVGIAWAAVRQQQPSLELYYVDGSHPSAAGSYLAGCTLYATIFHQNPAGLSGKVTGIPVNLATAKAEPEKTAVLVDLPVDQARLLQSAAWDAWQQLQKNGGYLALLPAPMPVLPPLPAGMQLSAAGLEGIWSGDLLLYPPPFLPSEMVLRLHRDGANWKGHLEIKFHSQDQADESFDLIDLHVRERELTFTDPKGVQNLRVRFRGVCPQAEELNGTAEATMGNTVSPARLLGTWKLQRKQ